jgi:Zn finger protein HypA/HybF involved in hydrogenase expression
MMIDERPPMFECDCCGKRVHRLHHVEAYGLETFACDECAGYDAAAYGEDEDEDTP